ncbi:MAG: purine-nucleoside phosphorylase [Tissierellia bacterium]|nr:purine-nucleoside phosphorylase [Tissierellia bacterium]
MIKTLDYDYFKKSSDYILERIEFKPEIAIILGSCLGNLADEIENQIIIDYKDIPNFLQTTVSSHAGKLIMGQLSGKNVICMSGRFHYYEGYDFEELTVPIRVMHLLGVETVILTNAAGAVNKDFVPGDIMIINDQIKLNGPSPVRGKNLEEFGPRFFDMSYRYDRDYIKLAKEVGKNSNIKLQEGVYFYMPGPQFETPAEIRAIRVLGGDAVGMSTVTEAIVAAHCGMKVLGLSLMSNMAAGVLDQPLTTEEVDETAEKSAENFKVLLKNILKEM